MPQHLDLLLLLLLLLLLRERSHLCEESVQSEHLSELLTEVLPLDPIGSAIFRGKLQ